MAPSVAVENLNPKVRNAARSPSPCLPVLSLEGPILRDSSEERSDFDDLEEVLWMCCTVLRVPDDLEVVMWMCCTD